MNFIFKTKLKTQKQRNRTLFKEECYGLNCGLPFVEYLTPNVPFFLWKYGL